MDDGVEEKKKALQKSAGHTSEETDAPARTVVTLDDFWPDVCPRGK